MYLGVPAFGFRRVPRCVATAKKDGAISLQVSVRRCPRLRKLLGRQPSVATDHEKALSSPSRPSCSPHRETRGATVRRSGPSVEGSYFEVQDKS